MRRVNSTIPNLTQTFQILYDVLMIDVATAAVYAIWTALPL